MADDAQDFVDSTPDYKETSRDYHGRLKPGFTANPEGRPKTAVFKRAAMRYLEEHPEVMARIVERMFSKAQGHHENRFGEEIGDLDAAAFLRDTIDGKPKQAVEVSGDGEGGPVLVQFQVVDEKGQPC
jgi:hypothetical protein